MPPTVNSRRSTEDLPAEFFLPPRTSRELWRETARLLAGALVFLILLAVLVWLTQDVVVTL